MNDFKIGDVVKCVDNEGLKDIKKNKTYIVSNIQGNCIKLDTVWAYPTSRFRLIARPTRGKAIGKFTIEQFSVLNEKDAEKYIGKVMEFADADFAKRNDWLKRKLLEVGGKSEYPFKSNCRVSYTFCRTCPETFKTKDLEKIKSIKEAIACLKSELERLEGE